MLIDIVKLKQNHECETSIIDQLLELFISKHEDYLQQLEQAFRAGDVDASVRALHKLKGMAANLSLSQLIMESEALENTLHTEQRPINEIELRAIGSLMKETAHAATSLLSRNLKS